MALETFLLLVAVTVIYTLSVYRIAMMVGLERGPADWVAKFHQRLRLRFPPPADAVEYLPPDQAKKHWIVAGAECPNCISFWLAPIAAVLVLLHLVAPPGSAGSWALYVCDFVALWWAITGVVVSMR